MVVMNTEYVITTQDAEKEQMGLHNLERRRYHGKERIRTVSLLLIVYFRVLEIQFFVDLFLPNMPQTCTLVLS